MVRYAFLVFFTIGSFITYVFAENVITSYTDENGRTVYMNQTKPAEKKSNIYVPPGYVSRNNVIMPAPSAGYTNRNKVYVPGASNTSTPTVTFDPYDKRSNDFQKHIGSTNRFAQSIIEKAAWVMAVWATVVIAGFLWWLISLIDILRNEFTGSNKIVWVILITFLPFLGALLYDIIGFNQKIKKEEEGNTHLSEGPEVRSYRSPRI
jgi:hypothetical protein